MIHVTTTEMRALAQFVMQISGIVLDDSKTYLVESRLAPLLEEEGCQSYAELHNKTRHNVNLTNRLIDAITTNETSFFRDKKPFDFFYEKILPDFATNQQCRGRLKVWSAACSTGQEAYSLAMLAKEFQLRQRSGLTLQIVGTDIADSVLARAKEGNFSRHEVMRGIPSPFLEKYFRREGERYVIHEDLRAMTFFQKVNLLKPFTELGKFDVICCRNVAIYFGLEDRKMLFRRLQLQLQPWGILLVGTTESLFGISEGFVRKEWNQIAYYQHK